MTSPISTSHESGTRRCARHPNTETLLRCGRCDTPICTRCMIMSPVGARCRECAQVKRFALLLKPIELVRAVGYGLAVGALGAVIFSFLPLALIGQAVTGFAVGDVVSRGANRKRVPALAPIAVACFLLGYLLGIVLLGVGRGAEIGPLLLALLRAARDLYFIVGLFVGALLAWMRTR